MKLADLQSFVVVAETGDLSHAAARLYRTEPAVSASIRRLERAVGQRLFEPVPARRPRLTTGGEVLLAYATQLLTLQRNVCGAIARLPVTAVDTPASLVRDARTSGIYDLARETPVSIAAGLSHRVGYQVALKREDLQTGFSFKIRGAYHRMLRLSDHERTRGVVAASAGNHAQGVALAARHLGIDALIVMPVNTPRVKIAAVRRAGAAIELMGDAFDDAQAYAARLCEQRGATFIHAFDDPLVVAGQGTIGVELDRQLPGSFKAVYVPVGGGGLIAGVGAVLEQLRPDVQIVGVEPEGADGLSRSLAAGRPLQLDSADSFAEGVAVRAVGRHTFAIASRVVDRVVRVSNEQICEAIREVYDDLRVVLEPSGAVAAAGLLSDGAAWSSDATVVAILSGANLDFDRLPDLVRHRGAGGACDGARHGA